jgi:hypothetical protein
MFTRRSFNSKHNSSGRSAEAVADRDVRTPAAGRNGGGKIGPTATPPPISSAASTATTTAAPGAVQCSGGSSTNAARQPQSRRLPPTSSAAATTPGRGPLINWRFGLGLGRNGGSHQHQQQIKGALATGQTTAADAVDSGGRVGRPSSSVASRQTSRLAAGRRGLSVDSVNRRNEPSTQSSAVQLLAFRPLDADHLHVARTTSADVTQAVRVDNNNSVVADNDKKHVTVAINVVKNSSNVVVPSAAPPDGVHAVTSLAVNSRPHPVLRQTSSTDSSGYRTGKLEIRPAVISKIVECPTATNGSTVNGGNRDNATMPRALNKESATRDGFIRDGRRVPGTAQGL